MREYYLSIISGRRTSWDAAIVCAVLRLISWVYAGIVYGLRGAYQRGLLRSYHLGRPVISVGNITWGGVGKTPFVEWVIGDLLSVGRKPVVLMRGYMSKEKASGIESDEAQLLHRSLSGQVPVIAQKDRVQGALKVPQDYPHDAFVLDDGFQHWRVKRDLEIVLIDAINPFGNGTVLPRGILREPLSALKSADLIVITKSDLGKENITNIKKTLLTHCPGAPVIHSIHKATALCDLRSGAVMPLSDLNDREVILVSGIGNPQGFQKTVESLGAVVKQHCIFGDHCVYTNADIERILYCLEMQKLSDVVITSKDAVKMKSFLTQIPESVRVLELKIKMQIIEGEEGIRDAIRAVYYN